MNRVKTLVVIGWLLCCVSAPSGACSMAGCLNGGVEVNRYFTVMIKHGGKPLSGVAVQIGGEGSEQFSGLTSTDGRVRVNLSPGLYWLKAELLGISAAYECFHIDQQASKRAKRRLTFDWGDLAPAVRRIAGKLVDSQPGKSGAPLWNLLHRTDVPIVGASLKLQDPVTSSVQSTTSDGTGGFAFDSIPAGIYVLHIEGGMAGERGYDATDLLIELSPTASRNDLVLARQEAGGGSCGGTSLDLRSPD